MSTDGTPTPVAGEAAVDAPPGEFVCSDPACRRRWRHGGGPLRFAPVGDGARPTTSRRLHPCPSCLQAHPAIAGFAHELHRRRASDLLGWTASSDPERPGDQLIIRAADPAS